ncbi:alpha/beta hydrolase family protein [Chitinophaga ginsengisoli]|uniref:Dipeptidyl aminopeptidase/acylaminoacyl peptidase n=1 Tax=Chitinophaga ginsengisoli TaxID=363837 RepID=A0A2P8GHT4_9BACT|nr:prolyl oligopeptidase family serine peptidase [Chitinophaga ginsengisoli]PSL33536.1 dipeptidyl aminopeptidase/acylaminoacyl peptidase [Chitinophaga ginsengisoli]
MKYTITILLCLYISLVNAQKPPINNFTYKSWEMLVNYQISDNGKYVWYTYGSELTGSTLVVRAVHGSYSKLFTGVWDAVFVTDNQHLVFNSPKGLGVLTLGTSTVNYIPRINNYTVAGNGKWLAVKQADTLLLKNLHTTEEHYYAPVTTYLFNKAGNVLVYYTKDSLMWMEPATGQSKLIAIGDHIDNITFNHADTAIAFTDSSYIYYFGKGMDSAKQIQLLGLKPGTTLSPMPLKFSPDDKLIFLKVARERTPSPKDTGQITDKLSVWDYRDVRLHSQVAPDPYSPFTALVPVSGGVVIQLENTDTTLSGLPGNQYALVSNVVNEEDAFWDAKQVRNYDLVSLTNGTRKHIVSSSQASIGVALSPAERYVSWFDPATQHFFIYEINTGVTRNISADVPTMLTNTHICRDEVWPYGAAGWLSDDQRLLIYDEFDIWQLDPRAGTPPLNITDHYGQRYKTMLRVVYPQQLPTLRENDPLLVTCLDSNKYNGFMHVKAGVNHSPQPVNMEPAVYHFPALVVFEPPVPLKAKKADVYILQRQTATQAPNLVTTTDFKTFRPLSDLQPQQAYNWLTTELVHWQIPGGSIGTGILYKPEDFDSTRQYPIIFHYYERRSNELYLFPKVRLSNGPLTIAWYVSNGYLVFVPDIYRPTGQNGPAILNTVVSAAQYLSTRPYVNTKRMGLQGHSFGGYETNYLIAHTHLFAAAQSSAAPSELFGLHGGLGFGGRSYHYISELGQLNQGVAPWENPDLYVQTSPILFAREISTPLLMMHNKEDGAVPFSQSVALFTALRRLKKPVWLLEYQGEGHVLFDPGCQLDFSIKQEEFFDYYLRNKPAPAWMR